MVNSDSNFTGTDARAARFKNSRVYRPTLTARAPTAHSNGEMPAQKVRLVQTIMRRWDGTPASELWPKQLRC